MDDPRGWVRIGPLQEEKRMGLLRFLLELVLQFVPDPDTCCAGNLILSWKHDGACWLDFSRIAGHRSVKILSAINVSPLISS